MIEEGRFDEALKLLKETNLKRTEVCRQLDLDYDALTYFIKSRCPELLNKRGIRKYTDYNKNTRKDTAKRYSQALQLAQTTTLSYKEIAEQTGVSLEGFKTYIQKHHRDLMLQRKGLAVSKRQANAINVCKNGIGQTVISKDKYEEAIADCRNPKFIELTVTDIARKYELRPSSLLAQLRNHYPMIIQQREKLRAERGIVDNRKRGARARTMAQYAEAVELYANSEKSLEEIADECNVSFTGFRNHLLEYHKDLVKRRRSGSSSPSPTGGKQVENQDAWRNPRA